MLRIDVGVPDSDSAGYRVPADNPFLDRQPISALGEIWDFGLRNPWRYSFDDLGPGATGALIIADVGQAAREEINYEPRGAGGRNYGWRIREGRIATPNVPATTPAFGPLTDPIFDYGRDDGRAITGGYVYRGQALGASYRGRYFFADSETARVWSLGLSVNPTSGEATVVNVIEHTAELGGSLGADRVVRPRSAGRAVSRLAGRPHPEDRARPRGLQSAVAADRRALGGERIDGDDQLDGAAHRRRADRVSTRSRVGGRRGQPGDLYRRRAADVADIPGHPGGHLLRAPAQRGRAPAPAPPPTRSWSSSARPAASARRRRRPVWRRR